MTKLATATFCLCLTIGCGRTTSVDSTGDTLQSPTQEFVLTEDLRLGDADPLFGVVSDIAVNRDGDIYVGETRSPRTIRIFNASGYFTGTLGAAGEGPGEYRFPGRILMRGDSIVVFDRPAFVVYDDDGSFRARVRLNDPYNSARLRGLAGRGFVVVRQAPLSKEQREPYQSKLSFYVADRSGNLDNPVWSASGDRQMVTTIPGGIYSRSFPFSPTTICTVQEHRLICSWTEYPEFYSVALEGDAGSESESPIRIAIAPLPVSAADRAAATQSLDDPLMDQLEFPEYHPALEGLISDDRGRVWARMRVEPGEATSHYWIVDLTRRTVARALIAGNVDLRVVQNGHAYGIVRAPTGEQVVARYKLAEG